MTQIQDQTAHFGSSTSQLSSATTSTNSHSRIDEQHDPPLHATPALLRTCKQVYDEARDLLYAKSTLHVTVKCTLTNFRDCSLAILGNGFASIPHKPSLLELRAAFPQHVMEVGTLKWTTQLICGFQPGTRLGYTYFTPLNRLLYTLANCYRQGKLCLTLETLSPFDPASDGLWHVFWPIAKVREEVALKLAGFDIQIEQRIMSLRRDREAAEVLRFDIVEDWQSFVSKLNLRQLRPGAECDMDRLTVAANVQSNYQTEVESSEREMNYTCEQLTISMRRYLVKYFSNYVETARRGAHK